MSQDDSYSDDSDFDEQLMQHLVAAASRARYVHRRERKRYSGAGPSEVFVFDSSMPSSGVQPALTTSPSGGSPPTAGVPSSSDIQTPTSESGVPIKPRYKAMQFVIHQEDYAVARVITH